MTVAVCSAPSGVLNFRTVRVAMIYPRRSVGVASASGTPSRSSACLIPCLVCPPGALKRAGAWTPGERAHPPSCPGFGARRALLVRCPAGAFGAWQKDGQRAEAPQGHALLEVHLLARHG